MLLTVQSRLTTGNVFALRYLMEAVSGEDEAVIVSARSAGSRSA